jgi:hypothetical protein
MMLARCTRRTTGDEIELKKLGWRRRLRSAYRA